MSENGKSTPRILVFEDEPDLVELYEEILRLEGYQVKSCTDLESARYTIKNEMFDILISDWKFGAQTAGTILLNKEYFELLPKIVIIISGFVRTESFPKDLPEHCRVVEKPFNTSALITILQEEIAKLRNKSAN